MICFNALRGGDLDVYAEYTGTGLVNILKRDVISDPDETYRVVREAFQETYGLVWLEPFGFNNTHTITVREDQAAALGIRTISDLAAYVRRRAETGEGEKIEAGFNPEFMERPDGYTGLKTTYAFEFPKVYQMETGRMYKACKDGDVDVICAFATDGRIPAFGLRVLEDDKGFFPPYYAAPLVRREALEKHPRIRDALNRLAGALDDETMRSLNYRVDEKGENPYQIAHEFLTSKGLIGEKPGAQPADEPSDGGQPDDAQAQPDGANEAAPSE